MWAEILEGKFDNKIWPTKCLNDLKQKYYKQNKIVVLEFAPFL